MIQNNAAKFNPAKNHFTIFLGDSTVIIDNIPNVNNHNFDKRARNNEIKLGIELAFKQTVTSWKVLM